MILTDYYCLERLPGTKSKQRLDCTLSTMSYPEFEQLRNKKGELFLYFGDVPPGYNGHAKRKATKALTKVNGITSFFVPDITIRVAYGDVKGTNDALLAVHDIEYNIIEILIARGQKNNAMPLYNLFTDGELLDEVERLKKSAKPEGQN